MTAFECPGQRIPLVAGAALLNRFEPVKVNDKGEVIPAAAGEAAVGVSQREAVLGEAASVMINGVSFCKLGEQLAPGDEVEVGEGSVVKKLATGKRIGIVVVGGPKNALGSIIIK